MSITSDVYKPKYVYIIFFCVFLTNIRFKALKEGFHITIDNEVIISKLKDALCKTVNVNCLWIGICLLFK